ncbi:hypothetical protein EW146_g3172 [Bondarzewia mesenterica]|uniref:F-box domain-containing protein n=1 Tax=Bondarzewia mesenterica TaxID=1095465 RepID=A0A4S4LZW5_9AGAM|nr:hypothetical protein EW146_g3172 [Bondarzewia mesenterica]
MAGSLMPTRLPLELLRIIVKTSPELKDLLKMRLVNSTFYHWATPLAFRTVAVENTTRSIHNFIHILDSPRLKVCITDISYCDVHSDENGNMLIEEDIAPLDLQSLRPREGFEELSVIGLLGIAFARLHELPMLRDVTINLNPEYDEECRTEDNTGYYPSWRYQEAMVGELRKTWHMLRLSSLTINNILASRDEEEIIWDYPLFNGLSHLHLTVVTDPNDRFEDSIFDDYGKFWARTIQGGLHRLTPEFTSASLSPSPTPLSPSLVHGLTCLSLHNDQYGVIPTLTFAELTFPRLIALSLEFFVFDAVIDTEDFIVRHGAPLTHLELSYCTILIRSLTLEPSRLWRQVWTRFAFELDTLVELGVYWATMPPSMCHECHPCDSNGPLTECDSVSDHRTHYSLLRRRKNYAAQDKHIAGKELDEAALKELYAVLGALMPKQLPLELLKSIVECIPSLVDLLKIRLVNSTFYDLATPLAFRAVTVQNTTRSVNNFDRVLKSASLKVCIKKISYCDVFSDEDGCMLTEEDVAPLDLQSLRPRQGKEEYYIMWTLQQTFSRLRELPALREVILNFNPVFDEEAQDEDRCAYYPSWRYQEATIGELWKIWRALRLSSLTIHNLLGWRDRDTEWDSYPLFDGLSHLHLSVVSSPRIGMYLEDFFVQLWKRTIQDGLHRLVPEFTSTRSSPPPLSSSLSRGLTSLTLHSDQLVGIVPALSFAGLTFPGLTQLSLKLIFFDERTGTEDFIMRHHSTLTKLELLNCSIFISVIEQGPARSWSQVWSRFANGLDALVYLHVQRTIPKGACDHQHQSDSSDSDSDSDADSDSDSNPDSNSHSHCFHSHSHSHCSHSHSHPHCHFPSPHSDSDAHAEQPGPAPAYHLHILTMGYMLNPHIVSDAEGDVALEDLCAAVTRRGGWAASD